MMQAQWLPIIMEATFTPVFVIECDTLQLLHVNEAACQHLQASLTDLGTLPFSDLLDSSSREILHQKIQSLTAFPEQRIEMTANLLRADGAILPVALRLCAAPHGAKHVCIAFAASITRPKDNGHLDIPQSLFRGIVSSTPGLVYQFQLTPDDKTAFTYLSDACQALLGLSAEKLRTHPNMFLDLILPDDRPSYLKSMTASANDLKSWNWEGRIWIDAWKDIKWINLRATPHILPNKSVQWSGIMTNITQSKLEEFEIKRSRARLAELSAHIEQVKEQERTQLAREVHDDLGGNLTAIKMALALLAQRLPSDDSFLTEKAQYVDSLVDRTIESAHRIASDLRPSILDLGIVAALQWQTEEFEKQLGIPCNFSSTNKEIELSANHATAIFRIFQEALTNIAKHANATRVTVKLSASRGSLNLKIIDNGKGIEPADRMKSQSFGIRGMTERAHSLGGKLTITTTDGGGSTVTIKIPQK
ncbi:MAG: two-component sensor histidine kinase [Oxalobacter sp.]|nr:MAG: two-component sensor histidine kinase [Oxalobacter sp.]